MAASKKKLPRGVKRITYLVALAHPTKSGRSEAEPACSEAEPVGNAAEPARRIAEPAPSKVAPAASKAEPTPSKAELASSKAEPARSETVTPPVSSTPPGVVITHIQYDGKVGRVEADEYIEIQNQGPSSVDLSGWRVSAGSVGQDFRFPAVTILLPKQSVRVYTNEIHPETGGFSFGSARAIWNNRGDVGVLVNRSGVEVSRWAYGRKATPT